MSEIVYGEATRNVKAHYDGSAPTYHLQYDSDLIWQNAEYPSNYFRLEKVIEILRKNAAQSVYEFGAGEASPMIRIHQELGIRIEANDLSTEMVRLGKENLSLHGMDPEALTQVDLTDAAAVAVEQARVGTFDAVIALGVIPHVENDQAFVEAMSSFLKPGGLLILQFRNSMFSMFTFNRLTKELILEDLLVGVPDEFKQVVAADLDQRLAVDKPPKREEKQMGPAYDEILARFHNPFELSEIVKDSGFTDLHYRWYNFHPTYPMISGAIDAETYREAQIALEADESWRGMFLCSAGMIIATKS